MMHVFEILKKTSFLITLKNTNLINNFRNFAVQ